MAPQIDLKAFAEAAKALYMKNAQKQAVRRAQETAGKILPQEKAYQNFVRNNVLRSNDGKAVPGAMALPALATGSAAVQEKAFGNGGDGLANGLAAGASMIPVIGGALSDVINPKNAGAAPGWDEAQIAGYRR